MGRADLDPSARYALLTTGLTAGAHTVYAHYTGYFYPPSVSIGASSSEIVTQVAEANYGRVEFGGAVAVPVVPGSDPATVGIADVTGDGRADLLATTETTSTTDPEDFSLFVFTAEPGGGWVQRQVLRTHASGLSTPARLASGDVGDVTGDGRADVTATLADNRPESQVVVYPQTATGELGPPVRYAAYDIPEPIVLADVDRDGRRDVVVAHGSWEQVGVRLQRPNGLLGREQFSWVPRSSHYDHRGLAVGDITGDGKPDVVLADYNHRLILLYQL